MGFLNEFLLTGARKGREKENEPGPLSELSGFLTLLGRCGRNVLKFLVTVRGSRRRG